MYAGITQLGETYVAAAGGRKRQGVEEKKQGAMRNAPNEQCDYVFEGSAAHFLNAQK